MPTGSTRIHESLLMLGYRFGLTTPQQPAPAWTAHGLQNATTGYG